MAEPGPGEHVRRAREAGSEGPTLRTNFYLRRGGNVRREGSGWGHEAGDRA